MVVYLIMVCAIEVATSVFLCVYCTITFNNFILPDLQLFIVLNGSFLGDVRGFLGSVVRFFNFSSSVVHFMCRRSMTCFSRDVTFSPIL